MGTLVGAAEGGSPARYRVRGATTQGTGETGNRSVTVERFQEIERRLRDRHSLREIARAPGRASIEDRTVCL